MIGELSAAWADCSARAGALGTGGAATTWASRQSQPAGVGGAGCLGVCCLALVLVAWD